MRKSSLVMLAAAIVLGLAAVFFARMFLVPGDADQQGPAVASVAATSGQAEVAGRHSLPCRDPNPLPGTLLLLVFA